MSDTNEERSKNFKGENREFEDLFKINSHLSDFSFTREFKIFVFGIDSQIKTKQRL